MAYALHFALRPGRTRLDIVAAVPGNLFTGAFVDGDSFVAWGEPQGSDPAHATLFFQDRSQADLMWHRLVAAQVADIDATCSPTETLNHVVTDARDWEVLA